MSNTTPQPLITPQPLNSKVRDIIISIGTAYARYYTHQSETSLLKELEGLFTMRKSGFLDSDSAVFAEAFGFVLRRLLKEDVNCVIAPNLRAIEYTTVHPVLTNDQKIEILLTFATKHPALIDEANGALSCLSQEIARKKIGIKDGNIHGFHALKNYPQIQSGLTRYVRAHLDRVIADDPLFFPDLVGNLADSPYAKYVGAEHIEAYLHRLKNASPQASDAAYFHSMVRNKYVAQELACLAPDLAYIKGPDIQADLPDSKSLSNAWRRVSFDPRGGYILLQWDAAVRHDYYKADWVKNVPADKLLKTYMIFGSLLATLQGNNDNGITIHDRSWQSLQEARLGPLVEKDFASLKAALQTQMRSMTLPDILPTEPMNYGRSSATKFLGSGLLP